VQNYDVVVIGVFVYWKYISFVLSKQWEGTVPPMFH